MKREYICSNNKGHAVQLWIQLPDILPPRAGDPFLTSPTCWWGAQGFLRLFFVTGLPVGIFVLCRKEWNPQSSQHTPGEIMVGKLIVKTWDTQLSARWDCPCPKPSGQSLGSPGLQVDSLLLPSPEPEDHPPSSSSCVYLILCLLHPLSHCPCSLLLSLCFSPAVSFSRGFSLFGCISVSFSSDSFSLAPLALSSVFCFPYLTQFFLAPFPLC